jgi:hypothetical protein
MRGLVVAIVLSAVLSGCSWHCNAHVRGAPCTPPAGGRCAADVAWPGPIELSPDGQRLHGIVLCGGTLHAIETSRQVTVTLHVGAMGPGIMSCARVDIGVRLSVPLGSRAFVDGVSGTRLRVVH